MSFLIVAPIVVTFSGAALSFALGNRIRGLQPAIAVVATALLLVIAVALLLTVSSDGIQVLDVGEWPAPMGIVLVADLLSAIMLCLTGVLGLAVVLYSLTSIDEDQSRDGYYPLLLVLLGGISGAFLTGDFFNLYVWFEVLLMASFILLVLGGGRLQLEGALKYMALNILSSVIFLTALGLLYSATGTLNFADLAVRIRESSDSGLITTLSMLFLVAFGIKGALFPFFFWLPASYHTPPVAVSAVFAGLLTKVGVYALIRVFTLLFVSDTGFTHELILVISGITMVVGVLGAVAQNEFRKILAFHSISQIGYMTAGLGLFSVLGIAGAIFYVVHHTLVKSTLFLISGLVYRLRGSFELKNLGGMRSETLISLLFLASALSLAGAPPLTGFFAKLTLIRAGVEAESYAVVAVFLIVGLLTLFSMTKIWSEVFAKDPVEPKPRHSKSSLPELTVSALLVVLMVCLGLGAEVMFDLTQRTAEQLLDPSQYITAVLGEGGAE